MVEPSDQPRDLAKALRVVNLTAQVFSRWSEDEGNLKQALIASERAVLWSWHRIQLADVDDRDGYYREFGELWQGYNEVAHRYFAKLQDHLYVPDGLSGYCQENAEFSLVVFEQIGLIAAIGLCRALVVGDEETRKAEYQNATAVADGLAALLRNNPVSGSPRLDGNVIDITLGLLLLVSTGHTSQAGDWLAELVKRADYTFKRKRNFPICTDSTDDLIEATVFEDEELRARLMRTSWLLPTLAGWSVMLGRDDLYRVLAKNAKADYPEICLQLWHPTHDLTKHIYYWPAQYHCGESEAPIILPDTSDEFRERMKAVLDSERHDVVSKSPAFLSGVNAIDLVACRHFRTPVAPFLWYQLLRVNNASAQAEPPVASV